MSTGPRNVEDIRRRVFAVIAPFDVAGLTKDGMRNWYPVNASDLLNSCDKVGASREEAAKLLERCGFTL